MKKKTIACLLLLTLLFGCQADTKQVIRTDSEKEYQLLEMSDTTGSFYVGTINLYEAAEDELVRISTESYEGEPLPLKSTELAQAAASILDSAYTDWSSAGTVVLRLNTNANVWIIHGQLSDRYTDFGEIGILAVDAETGKVICMTLYNEET